jgi:hypothetical protein
MVVESGRGSEQYRPDLTIGSDGTLWVAWDAWRERSYQVFVSRLEKSGWTAPQNVSANPGYDCYRPKCAAAPSGDIWVTWNAVSRGDPRWGTAISRIGLDHTQTSVVPPGFVPNATNFAEITLDAQGRPWVLWQERELRRTWTVFAACLGEDGWAGPYVVLEEGQDARQFAPSAEQSGNGGLCIVWSSGVPVASSIPVDRMENLDRSAFAREPIDWTILSPAGFSGHPTASNRGLVRRDKKTYHLYWGDFHNHSEISDGRQPIDHAFALARDVYGLDFFCTADHDAGITEGEWRLTQAISSCMNEPGRFVSFAGYESSDSWAKEGVGHRNVVYPDDHSTVCRFREGTRLDELLRCVGAQRGIAIPHHVGKWFAPVDWNQFDAVVQPIVEICSAHGVFEYFGNPSKQRSDLVPIPLVDRSRSPVEGSFVQDGWARGLRFGVVGSTDSHINHSYGIRGMALAAVYAEDLTREGLFEAFRARRTYGTTGVRAIMDFRVNGHLMGEEFELERGKNVSVTVDVEAPVRIQRLDIVRDNETVYSKVVDGHWAGFSWRDSDPSPYSTYYYARVVMEGDNYAWSSPVWIDWE